MPVQSSFNNISIENLRDSNTWNLHPFLANSVPESLISSITKVGILHPPIVLRNNEGTYDIVNGRKRIKSAGLSGKLHVFCRVFSQSTPVKTLLTFLLEDQLTASPLSLPEAAIFLRLCIDHLGEEEAIALLPESYLPRKNPLQILQFLEFGNDFLKKIHLGQLTEKILPDLLQLTRRERQKIVHLIEALNLGGNKQKRLISLCRDISLRHNILLGSLLDDTEFKEVIEHPLMNIPQKTTRIFDILQRRCFPLSSRAKEIFQSQVRDLLLPETFTISPSPFFERDETTLSIRFPDYDTCKEALPLLKDVLKILRK